MGEVNPTGQEWGLRGQKLGGDWGLRIERYWRWERAECLEDVKHFDPEDVKDPEDVHDPEDVKHFDVISSCLQKL